MDNVVSISRKSDVHLLIEGCIIDMQRQDKFGLQHHHTMWVLKEIMMNPAHSDKDRLWAAFVAYENSGYKQALDQVLHLVEPMKHTNLDAKALLNICNEKTRAEWIELLGKLVGSNNDLKGKAV